MSGQRTHLASQLVKGVSDPKMETSEDFAQISIYNNIPVTTNTDSLLSPDVLASRTSWFRPHKHLVFRVSAALRYVHGVCTRRGNTVWNVTCARVDPLPHF
jgi:hypothetical protein